MLIPPSVLLILYGIVARESIGALFTAGIVPGIVLALVYSTGISLMVKIRPQLVKKPYSADQIQKTPGRFRLKMLVKTLPMVTAMGYSPIWFGIISIMAIETGLITLPFGIVVYTMKATLGHEVSVEQVFRGSVPFLIMMFLVLGVVMAFPWLALWLSGKF